MKQQTYGLSAVCCFTRRLFPYKALSMYKNARDRLQPALLDRLRDDKPEYKGETQQHWVLSFEQLKQAVLRDLAWLLNTISLSAHENLQAYPQVQSSTLNFGVAALAGKRLSEIEWTEVEFAVHEAIVQFEPRILPGSLVVRCLSEAVDLQHHNVIALLIKGQLWANPYPLELLVRTEIDLESGQIALEEIDEEEFR